MKLVELKCDKCGAKLTVNSELNEISCNYCGNKMIIDDDATLIERIEDKKLNSRKKNHEQSVKEELDKIEIKKIKNKEEFKKDMMYLLPFVVIIIICMLIIFIDSFSDPKVPSLENYNKIEMGMSYSECKDILKVEGHRTEEKGTETVYEWYDPDCESGIFKKCGWIVQLKFTNDKLVEREEKGLK